MSDKPVFVEFGKIHRYSREVVVTEKIDGSNGQVHITDSGEVLAASRSGWTEDNFGFALWVEKNKEDLKRLGPGSHFGEWWGAGIQRRYGLNEKRFSLFNVDRWSDPAVRPTCCYVVPVLWRGLFDEMPLVAILEELKLGGSRAAPGFMRPEGVVIFHIAGRVGFKKTLEKDAEHKGKPR